MQITAATSAPARSTSVTACSTDVPCADQLITLTPLGGAGTCSTELWHMDNFQVPPATPYYEFTIHGVAGGCIDQDADNRRTTLGI